MKKLLLATLIGAAFAADATAVEFDYSYAEAVDTYFGYQKKESYDVAIFLPGETFEGMRITAINGPINTTRGANNYKNASVWLSSELKLNEKKKNDPSIASYEVEAIDNGDGSGIISLALPESYTVPAEGVYVGYSFEINAIDGGTKYPVGIGLKSSPNSFFVHSSKSVKTWTDLSGQGYASAISVELQADNLPAQNVSLTSLPDPIYMSFGEDKTVNVSLSSTASDPVSSLDFEFSFAGSTHTYHYDMPSEVPSGIGRNFEAKVVLPAQNEKMIENVEIKVAKVNGKDNSSSSNAKSATVSVFEIAPVHQTLIEEYTGTWCGWCTRGFAALEHIAKNYPDFVVAAYHNGDEMQVTTSYPASVDGFPSASLNRSVVCDPYYGTETYNSKLPIVDDILARNAEVSPWALKVSHTWDSSNELTAIVDATNIIGYTKGSYKIGYLLVSDGLSDAGWSQSNNYSSRAASEEYIPELNNFCSGGIYGSSSVKGLVFNDVVVSISGYKGISGSVPASLEAEESFTHSMTWDLSKISSTLVPDQNKLRIIAFVLDSKGNVLNCAKNEVNDFGGSAVGKIEGLDENAPVEFYNLNGVKVSDPSNGIFIRRQGGSAEKVIIK